MVLSSSSLTSFTKIPRLGLPQKGRHGWHTPLPRQATTGLPSNPLAMLEPPVDHSLIQHTATLINQSKKPIIYAGAGILSSSAGSALLSARSRRVRRDSRETFACMHGSAYANLAMPHADVIIALGACFDDGVTGKVDSFHPCRPSSRRGWIIHFEIMLKNIDKVIQANMPAVGDVVPNLRALVPSIQFNERTEWFSDMIRGGRRAIRLPMIRARLGSR